MIIYAHFDHLSTTHHVGPYASRIGRVTRVMRPLQAVMESGMKIQCPERRRVRSVESWVTWGVGETSSRDRTGASFKGW